MCFLGSGPGDVWRCDVLRHHAATGSAQTFASTSHVTACHCQAPPSGGALCFRVTLLPSLPASLSQPHCAHKCIGECLWAAVHLISPSVWPWASRPPLLKPPLLPLRVFCHFKPWMFSFYSFFRSGMGGAVRSSGLRTADIKHPGRDEEMDCRPNQPPHHFFFSYFSGEKWAGHQCIDSSVTVCYRFDAINVSLNLRLSAW